MSLHKGPFPTDLPKSPFPSQKQAKLVLSTLPLLPLYDVPTIGYVCIALIAVDGISARDGFTATSAIEHGGKLSRCTKVPVSSGSTSANCPARSGRGEGCDVGGCFTLTSARTSTRTNAIATARGIHKVVLFGYRTIRTTDEPADKTSPPSHHSSRGIGVVYRIRTTFRNTTNEPADPIRRRHSSRGMGVAYNRRTSSQLTNEPADRTSHPARHSSRGIGVACRTVRIPDEPADPLRPRHSSHGIGVAYRTKRIPDEPADPLRPRHSSHGIGVAYRTKRIPDEPADRKIPPHSSRGIGVAYNRTSRSPDEHADRIITH